jgi:hypothetical protein
MPLSSRTSGTFTADLVTGPLTVERFVDRATPGNVGICLSGGGSRALTAGMGQLRGLKALGLLEKTRAISTVSGGSWVGVTFEYLSGGTSDDAYLNEYGPDPGRLVPTATPGHTPAETPSPSASSTAARASIRPQPKELLGTEVGMSSPQLWAVVRPTALAMTISSIRRTSPARSGSAEISRATSPATCGPAIDVPERAP